VAHQTRGLGVDAAYDAAGVAAAVRSALDCLGEQRTLVCVATHEKPVPTILTRTHA
jgi:(R,R)-butanediol dehydrogenase/meso-butanediol dehydrogenase/diacetyl reductase